MDNKLQEMIDNLKQLENQINVEFEKKQKELKYRIEQGHIEFEKARLKQFKELKKNIAYYLYDSGFLTVLTAPVIYSLIFPCLLLDLFVSVYQHICFRVYGIPRVKRSDYICFDRHHLSFLNIIERFNCSYCSYFNGVIAYVREVASRTEQYWCPIRHALRKKGLHLRHHNFIPYGDAEHYYKKLEKLREDLKKLEA